MLNVLKTYDFEASIHPLKKGDPKSVAIFGYTFLKGIDIKQYEHQFSNQ
jgi:hypothetical protein